MRASLEAVILKKPKQGFWKRFSPSALSEPVCDRRVLQGVCHPGVKISPPHQLLDEHCVHLWRQWAPSESIKTNVMLMNDHLLWTTVRMMTFKCKVKVGWHRKRQKKQFSLSRQMWLSSTNTIPYTAGLSSFRLEYVGADHTAVTPRMKPLRQADVL